MLINHFVRNALKTAEKRLNYITKRFSALLLYNLNAFLQFSAHFLQNG